MSIFNSLYIKNSLNYYAGYLRTWQIKNKIILNKATFHTFNGDEKACLSKAQEIFNDQADFVDGYKQKDSFIVLLKNIIFLGTTGIVVKDGRIVTESVLDVNRMASSPSYRNFKILKNVKKEGVYTSIIHLKYSQNFYHWNIDCIPRMYNIKNIPFEGKINLIIHQDQPTYQKEVLDLFIKADPRLNPIYITNKEKWQINEYWLPSFLTSNQCGFMPKENVEYVRSIVITGYNIKPNASKNNIYISRSKTNRRKLLNEIEIENYLKSKGFEIIFAENHSFREQVEIISNAKTIISPHGAGLSNLLYATDAKVIEIHPENYVQTHYCMLSLACGHSYKCFLGSMFDSEKNYNVDINKFKNFIEKHLI